MNTQETEHEAPIGVSLEDAAELEAVCARMYPELVGGLRLIAGRAVAEELAQEALVRLWLRWSRVRSYRSPEQWLWRVAYNLATSFVRRRALEWRANRDHYKRERSPASNASPDADLTAALTSLSRRQRAAVVLRFYADMSVEDVAAVMACAPGTVKALTHQGLSRLRRLLDFEGTEEG